MFAYNEKIQTFLDMWKWLLAPRPLRTFSYKRLVTNQRKQASEPHLCTLVSSLSLRLLVSLRCKATKAHWASEESVMWWWKYMILQVCEWWVNKRTYSSSLFWKCFSPHPLRTRSFLFCFVVVFFSSVFFQQRCGCLSLSTVSGLWPIFWQPKCEPMDGAAIRALDAVNPQTEWEGEVTFYLHWSPTSGSSQTVSTSLCLTI